MSASATQSCDRPGGQPAIYLSYLDEALISSHLSVVSLGLNRHKIHVPYAHLQAIGDDLVAKERAPANPNQSFRGQTMSDGEKKRFPIPRDYCNGAILKITYTPQPPGGAEVQVVQFIRRGECWKILL